MIITELQRNIKTNKIWNIGLVYIRNANWQKFREQVEQNFDDETIKLIITLPADKAMRVFNNKLERCCEKAISKRRLANKTVP